MSLLVIVAVLLVGAVCLRLAAQSSSGMAGPLRLVFPGLALALLVLLILRGPADSVREIWVEDGVARTVSFTVCVTVFLLGLIDPSPTAVAALCWSGGLVCLGALAWLPAIQWGAVMLALLPVACYGRAEGVTRPGIVSRHPALIVGSVLFSIGFWILTTIDREHPGATIGMIALLCGLGGMLGWFPFPRVRSLSGHEETPQAIFARRLFPCLTAALLLLRLVERNPLGSSQMALMALAATFSLLMCGARLLDEERLSARLVLSSLSLFGFLLFAVCLGNWEVQNARRDWTMTSNLPSAATLFSSLVACELIGLLALLCGLQTFQSSSEEGDFSQALSGAVRERPFWGAVAAGGLMSVAGLPPFAGFWWRWGMVSAFLLPHRQSNVTQVMETDHLYAGLGLILTALLILNSAAHLPLLQRMLFADAFRLRSEQPSTPVRWAAACGLVLLVVLTCLPLSIESILSRGLTAGTALAVHHGDKRS